MAPWQCFNHAACGSTRERASKNSVRCVGSACKAALTAMRRQGVVTTATTEGPDTAAAEVLTEEMPDGMSVHEIEEILGEQCCKLDTMSIKKRKNGPGKDCHQQFLVRGTFLRPPDNDEDDQEDDTPEPNTYWVDKDELLQTIHVNDVVAALNARHEQLLSHIRPAKKGRRA